MRVLALILAATIAAHAHVPERQRQSASRPVTGHLGRDLPLGAVSVSFRDQNGICSIRVSARHPSVSYLDLATEAQRQANAWTKRNGVAYHVIVIDAWSNPRSAIAMIHY
jgi:hypothetical protein